MYQLIILVTMSTQLLISSLKAEDKGTRQEDLPAISVVCVKDDCAAQDSANLENVLSQMLYLSGYEHDVAKINLHKSQKNQLAIIETDKGKKFIKIKRRGAGLSEYLGALLFKDFAPILPIEKLIVSKSLELVVQPFNSLAEGNLLFHKIGELEFQDCPATWNLINSIFLDSLQLSSATMYYSAGHAKNDEFFSNRLKTQDKDGISGRIERIYKGKIFKLMHLELSWEELKTLNWKIEGISYLETLEELLAKAHHYLNLERSRLIGISHGNWHENNIIIDKTGSYDYAYYALEFSGENDLIADAIMFLTHTTLYADYLNPVYYPKAYGNEKMDENILKNTRRRKQREIYLSKNESTVTISDMGVFGTLNSRKEVAHVFNEKYFSPLIKQAVKFFGEEILNDLDSHTKAALLVRLLGGQDVSEMTPQDQAKIIGLIYQSIATPITGNDGELAINRFIKAL